MNKFLESRGCRLQGTAAILLLALSFHGWAADADAGKSQKSAGSVERGRYLVKIAGCNDCHTPGYAMSGGKVPESQWLVGDRLGWRGPWGTTYPSNLRLSLAKLTREQWVKLARNAQYRPPMPWFALRDMQEEDLRAIYDFTVSLGAAGAPAPAFVPPGQEPKGPHVTFPQPPK